MIHTINLKECQPFANYVRKINPTYRKHRIHVSVSETATLSGTDWSGGTRTTYRMISADGKAVRWTNGKPWPQSAISQDVDVPKGGAIEEGGTFCGKPATLRLILHPTHPLAPFLY